MDEFNFSKARNKIIRTDRNRQGIGTLQEKTLHAVLKNYYAPDQDMQEIPIDNYVADIYTGKSIIEIQTANFNKLREKLNVFLPQYPVMVVYPIAAVRRLVWINNETGECTPSKRVDRKGCIYDAFSELYKIKSYLKNKNLTLCFPLLEVEEYKLQNGWGKDKKNHASKYDRVPISLLDEIRLEQPKDYFLLIPYELTEPFTSEMFGKAVKISAKKAGLVLNILYYMDIVERIGKNGHAYLYKVCER